MRKMKILSYFILLLALLNVSFVGLQAAQPAANKKVMMILDASGSMWGKIKGKAKIDIARDVVKSILKDWDKNTELGLIAYGHRKKGDCGDIETLIPVSPVDAGKFMHTLSHVSPKGKTPIGAAVLKAAETLKYTEESATVILVSDGIETCGMDPCKLGAELKKKGVDFKAHVIGFDIRSTSATRQLKCLAQNTGGKYFSAKDSSALKQALVKTVKIVAKAKPKPAPKPAPKPVAGHTGMLLSAIPAEGAKLLERGITYEIYHPQKDPQGKRKQVTYEYDKGSKFLFKLKPGKYWVVAKYGANAVAEIELEVKPNQVTQHTFNLNAGTLALAGVPAEGAKPFDRGLNYEIYYPQKDLQGKRKQVTYNYDKGGKTLYYLKAGKYWVVVKYGANAVGETELEVKPNQATEYTFDMNVGTLALSGTLKEGGTPLQRGINYEIYYPQKDLQGNRKQVTYGYDKGGKTLYYLKAGKYWVVAKHGGKTAEQEVEIKANGVQEVTIVFK